MINKKIEEDLKRNQLSDYLPYLAFDEKTNEFINSDNSFGYIFECSALYFAGDKTVDSLSSLMRQNYGKNAILQFILFADTNIDDHCDLVKNGDKIKTPLTEKMSSYHAEFLKNPDAYNKKIRGNKLKNYRLFVCLKTKESLDEVVVNAFEETLNGTGLNPQKATASKLLSLIRQLLNNSKNKNHHYNKDIPISKQAIMSDTIIDFTDKDIISINDELVSVLSPKDFPDEVNKQGLSLLQVNELIGSYQGGINDLEQITTRFLWSCNILLDKVDSEIRLKNTLAYAQRAGSKISNSIEDRITALSQATKNINSEYYLKFIPSLIIFADNKKDLAISTARAIRLWESKEFLMQRETHIKHIMFLQALPFGLITGDKNKNIDFLDRHFIAGTKSIAAQLPIQGDYCGFGYPIVPFIGRKGQVQGLDLFSKGANNHNFLCCATSGSGKSFFINWLLVHYFSAGAKIRINDIGGSYKKICNLLGGVYIDIDDKNVNLNPFQSIKSNNIDNEDKEHDIETIVMILGEMIYSTTDGGELTAEETGLLTHAVKEAIAREIVENGIDFIQTYLSDIKEYSTSGTVPDSLFNRAKELSFNLCEFSSKGEYGYLFNGVSENSWQDNPFVVLELDSLSGKSALMGVVSLQIINMMTQEMYQGDRSEKKMSIFDEVAFMFGSSQRLAKVVEDGYRRARKYNGSFGTIFQSILDTQLFGRVGEVMNNNAAFKFYLESGDYQKAIDKGIITLDGFSAELLTGIKSNKPHYSEVFMDTPGGIGVSRLMVGPYGYAVATTDADDVVEIESYKSKIINGEKIEVSTDEALEEFAVNFAKKTNTIFTKIESKDKK
jgi:conjugal transfer ATP-binding protein TraC